MVPTRGLLGRVATLFFVGAAWMAMPATASAQFSPEAPAKNQSSTADTNVGFDGNFSQSVQLDLPPARGGLSVPLAITHNGGHDIDSVGVGWAIPLYSITRSTSLSQRKPFYGGTVDGVEPHSDERIFLDMGGSSSMLRPVGADGAGERYRPLVSGEYMSASLFNAGGLSWWVVRDSAGRSFVFDQIGAGTTGDIDYDRWFLTSVKDASGTNRIDLEYSNYVYDQPIGVLDPQAAPNPAPLIETRLASIRYSHAGTAVSACAKYRIELKYQEAPAGQISLFFTNSWPNFGQHLLGEINIWVHEDSSCSESANNRLRSYRFGYIASPDTGLPVLQSVDMLGRGVSDVNAGVPVARYSYGTAVQSDGAFHFVYQGAVSKPTDMLVPELNVSTSTEATDSQQLMDVNGDGRPDLVYSKDGKSYWHRNEPSASWSNGNIFATREEIELGGIGVDWNGDGRPDRMQSLERDSNGHFYWRLFLNTPGSTDPGEVVWKEAQIAVTHLRDILQPSDNQLVFNPTRGSLAWPPAQPNSDTCKVYVHIGSQWVLTAAPCEQTDPRTRQWGWLDNWRLQDVNGDGFPDLVFHKPGDDSWNGDQCARCPAVVANENAIPAQCRQGCMVRSDLDEHNGIGVFYHTGLNMTTPGINAANHFSEDPVTLYDGNSTDTPGFSACGLGRSTTDGTYSWQQCGLQDVNGDGIADYFSETSSQLVGTPSSAITRRVAMLGTGTPQSYPNNGTESRGTHPSFQAKLAMSLPGRINLANYKQIFVCNSDIPDWETQQYSGLIDMTGDGRPDYVYYGDDQHEADGTPLSMPSGNDSNIYWRVRVNTGVGFGPPHRIVPPRSMVFSLGLTRHHCNGQRHESRVVAALQDFDGDGRPDLLNAIDSGTGFYVSKLVGSGAIPGVPDAGKIVRVDNGYGGTIVVGYSSAKADATTPHQIPGPEIVVTSIARVASRGLSLGISELPTTYAYGDGRNEYDPFMHRWQFTGYRRRVERRTSSQTQLAPTFAKIIERSQRSDFPGDRFAQYVLLGSTRRTMYFDDAVGTDSLLSRDLYSEFNAPFQKGSDEQESGLVTHDDAVFTGGEECGDVPDPYDFDINDLFTGPAADFCRHTAITYQKNTSTWRGVSPQISSTARVETRNEVYQVDCFGRPVAKWNRNDTSSENDDTCSWTTYAGTTCADFDKAAGTVLSAPATLRITPSCKDPKTILVGSRYEYDGLPLGSVTKGWLTTTYKEIYNLGAPGSLVLDFKAKTAQYNLPFGNLDVVAEFDGGSGSRVTKVDGYDDFGIAAKTATVSGTGAAPQVTYTEYDKVLMKPTLAKDANGVTSRTYYDDLGRPTSQTVRDGTNPEYIVSSTVYRGDRLGPETVAPLPFFSGRRTTLTTYHSWTPVGSAPLANEATVSVAYLDEFGRLRFAETLLGSDYGAQSLITGYQTYDALGRVSFSADPFPLSELAHPYGTTTSYYDDNQVKCSIRASMGAASETPSDTQNIFPTCIGRSYEGLRSVARRRGPNELKTTGPQAGAYVETVSTSTNQVVAMARVQGTTRFESQSFGYDRLGHVNLMSRNATVASSGGPVVTWAFDNDSSGNVLERREPALAAVKMAYDGFGAVTKTSWTDPHSGATHAIVSSYDGLGREVERHSLLNGALDPDADVFAMAYDLASPEQIAFGATHLVGRLSNTTRGKPSSTATERTFLSYDALGRENDTGRINRLDPARRLFHELHVNGPSGRLQSAEYKLPDSPAGGEGAFYTYDTGGHLREVEWLDAAGAEALWRADDVTVRGEIQHIQLGSGATETFTFESEGRRLPKTYELSFGNSPSPSGVGYHHIAYDSYDGQGRVLQTTERLRKQFQPEVVTTSLYDYDVANRLGRARKQQVSNGLTSQQLDETYLFDPLGNMTTRRNNLSGLEVRYIPDTANDSDRLCRAVQVAVGAATPSGSCTHSYDERGAVTTTSSPSGTLNIAYTSGGSVQKVGFPNGAHMDFTYDAGGAVAGVVSTAAGADKRRDWRYGPNVEEALVANDNVLATDRQVAAVAGSVATVRRRADGTRLILYRHGDNKLIQDFTDQTRSLAQHLEFNPFGMPLVSDASVGSDKYTKYQWDGGDALRPFGVSLIGARLYDPSAGRFLERDPLIVPRSSSQVNPYAYAHGDPINKADSSGADPVINEWMAYAQLNALPGLIDDSPIGTAIRGVEHAYDFTVGVGEVAVGAAKNMVGGAVIGATVLTMAAFGSDDAQDYINDKVCGAIDGAIATYHDAGGGVMGALAVVNTVNPANMVVEGAMEFSAAIDAGDYRGAGRAFGKTGLGMIATVGAATGLAEGLAGLGEGEAVSLGRRLSPTDAPQRYEGPWTERDLARGLEGKGPLDFVPTRDARGAEMPLQVHHADQMPGSAIHEVAPGIQEHLAPGMHPNQFNQGVTAEMRTQDTQMHWWMRAREMGAGE